MFITIAGFGLTTPFVPLFLSSELGITDRSALSLWTGVAGGALGAGLFLASPIWGVLADRFGRKPMLIRAMVGGGAMIVMTGLARGPVDTTVYRFLFGALAGPGAIAIAMVSLQTPREYAGRAVGLVSSAGSLASAIGPAIGGVAASVLSLRLVFVAGGVLFFLGAIPIFVWLREARPERPSKADRVPLSHILRGLPNRELLGLAVLIACQAVLSSAMWLVQPMVVLRLIGLEPSHAAVLTGVAFSAAGVATAAAAAVYSFAAKRRGYRVVAVIAAMLYASALVLSAATRDVVIFIVGITAAGMMNGALNPALSTMLGLQAPNSIKATVFGIAASALAFGLLVGPLLGGVVSARGGPSAAILVAAALLVALAVVIWAAAPEPEAAAAA